MRRKLFWFSVVCLGVCALVAACSLGKDAMVGTGFLDVGDLRALPGRDHFVEEAVEMDGRLALRTNGCVTVVLDGVERMPLWPEGTDVVQASVSPTRYVVTLPGDVTLDVDDVSADAFSAMGVIDKGDPTFGTEAGELPEKVTSFLAYCGVEAAPVAFPDAATFVVRRT